MKFLPLDRPERIELAAGWLAQKENYQWLDFGNGAQAISPALLKVMVQRDTHFIRIYTSPVDDTPLGITALNNVDRRSRSAVFWGAAGDKSFRNRGHGTLAGSRFLTLAFRELGLHVIQTWVAEGNPSQRLVERLGFRFVGRQRQCHYIDGRLYDRLQFDLLASEHREVGEERWRRAQKAQRKATYAERPAHAG
jgi:RimJ/RimL family protein N-acetyltransferase